MKIRVYITTKATVFNPVDGIINHALHDMGYTETRGLRLGRFFEFEVDDSLSETEWRERIADALKKPLAGFPNPIMEEWRMEVVT